MDASRIIFGQFRARVIEPVLGYLGHPFGSEAAIRLLLGTAAQETQLAYLAQVPAGPGLGPLSIEPATHDDLHENFLKYRPDLQQLVLSMAGKYPDRRLQLATNWAYAVAVARLIYYRAPDPLPAPDDIDGMGKYWKRFYNTGRGDGQVSEFVSNYRRFIGG